MESVYFSAVTMRSSSFPPLIPGSELPRILIADDHRLFLDAVVDVLKSQFQIAGTSTVNGFTCLLAEMSPAIAVLDVSLDGANGFALVKQAKQQSPNLRVVFLSAQSGAGLVKRARSAGAQAYLTKAVKLQELVLALHTVLVGGEVFPPESSKPQNLQSQKPGLTARQVEVLRLIADGATAKEIAFRLRISVRTAEFHREAIMQRLNMHSSAHLTRYALANHLVADTVEHDRLTVQSRKNSNHIGASRYDGEARRKSPNSAEGGNRPVIYEQRPRIHILGEGPSDQSGLRQELVASRMRPKRIKYPIEGIDFATDG